MQIKTKLNDTNIYYFKRYFIEIYLNIIKNNQSSFNPLPSSINHKFFQLHTSWCLFWWLFWLLMDHFDLAAE